MTAICIFGKISTIKKKYLGSFNLLIIETAKINRKTFKILLHSISESCRELATRKSLRRESDSHSVMMISWLIDWLRLCTQLGNTKRYFASMRALIGGGNWSSQWVSKKIVNCCFISWNIKTVNLHQTGVQDVQDVHSSLPIGHALLMKDNWY